MTRQEFLMDRYEDALFSLMMDKVATQEGEKALLEKERLQEEPESIIPETLHRKCLKTISHYYAKKNAKATRKTVSNIISKIAIIALIGVLTFTIAFASSPTFRANTLNFVMETFDDHIEIRMGTSEKVAIEDLKITIDPLPNNCELIESSCSRNSRMVVYQINGEGVLKICLLPEHEVLNYDNEDAVYSSMSIADREALVFEAEEYSQIEILWHIPDYGIYCRLMATSIDWEALTNIFENLSIIK